MLSLASCWDGKWEAVPQDESIPQKTTTGADILVARVNRNILDPEVYREVPSGLFDDEDVVLYRRKFVLPGPGDSMGYLILTDRHPDNEPSTSILMELRVDKPQLNTPYQLSAASYTVHSPSEPTKEYRVDDSLSMIRFARLDELVAAGEFAFIAIERTKKDTVRIAGYFDIPFVGK
ncbi:MAG: hypothetical protein K0R82_1643 [Flavipsychrobacter sp.]|nr:hypothetical protein [Flavipsychrobacter sp.]